MDHPRAFSFASSCGPPKFIEAVQHRTRWTPAVVLPALGRTYACWHQAVRILPPFFQRVGGVFVAIFCVADVGPGDLQEPSDTNRLGASRRNPIGRSDKRVSRWSTQRSEDVPCGPQLAAKTVSGPVLLSHLPSQHLFSSVLQVSGTARHNVFETPAQKMKCLCVRQQP